MLSNMMSRNGVENKSLKKWIKDNDFKIIVNDKVTKRNRQDRQEILIINY